MSDILAQLDAVISSRIAEADPSSSYVAKLHHSGLDRILKKLGEESAETIIAAKNAAQSEDKQELIGECADLIFHMLVMLAHTGLNSTDVSAELARRFNISGLTEKAARPVSDKI